MLIAYERREARSYNIVNQEKMEPVLSSSTLKSSYIDLTSTPPDPESADP